ncbi:Toxin to DNA-damage-inducible protein J [Streptococcus pseudoporcinus]|uniref:Toxin to DNA-damage-inducible protein J n=1 Tax=Streptococcus pseudoporcinus TaxID=361101 RepID=A0A4U9YTC6_9STRE|nr:type II toxin-antitoxin system RelE/ParE family toxin [Streptococcus pseudoporcinus]VTS30335.1 Toxin to DNA-damage-inducible protein J [Streptococcus pseudoporcinus]
MESKIYEIRYSSQVAQTLLEIRDYIFEISKSENIADKNIEKIIKGIEVLKLFPEAGFNADKKFGKKIDEKRSIRGITLKKNYIALYDIDDKNFVVNIRYLLATKSDYMKLFK